VGSGEWGVGREESGMKQCEGVGEEERGMKMSSERVLKAVREQFAK